MGNLVPARASPGMGFTGGLVLVMPSSSIGTLAGGPLTLVESPAAGGALIVVGGLSSSSAVVGVSSTAGLAGVATAGTLSSASAEVGVA